MRVLSLPPLASQRLLVGLIQGILLYLLHHAAEQAVWPATDGMAFAPLYLIAAAVPVLIILNLGSMRPRKVLGWVLPAAAIIGALAMHDVARRGPDNGVSMFHFHAAGQAALYPSLTLCIFLVAGLIIAQSLVAAADAEDRIIASYPRYFDVAWKLVIQLNFSLFFVGAFWLVLGAGVMLFKLITISFLADLLKHDWFNIPVTVLAFAAALHVTDVRASLVRGIRTLKLALLSWLLPIMTGFVVIFVVGLPYKGLALLWVTHHASQILLGTSAWLILLINAAYQDGGAEHRPGKLLRYSASIGAVLLLPLIAIALYALFLRVGLHGWTVNLIDVCACLGIALCYAGGYCWAVLGREPWLQRLERTNIYTAFVILAVLLALFTPLADPARLSVNDQVARLLSGKVSADKFDYAYLKNKGQAYGIEALRDLDKHPGLAQADSIKERSEAALKQGANGLAGPFGSVSVATPTADEWTRAMTVYPAGHALPDSFMKKDWAAFNKSSGIYLSCLHNRNMPCDAYIIDNDNKQPQQIILTPTGGGAAVLFRAEGDQWATVGTFSNLINCVGVREALRAGRYHMLSVVRQDLQVNGIDIQVNQQETCPAR